jgi:hypothetical protein
MFPGLIGRILSSYRFSMAEKLPDARIDRLSMVPILLLKALESIPGRITRWIAVMAAG